MNRGSGSNYSHTVICPSRSTRRICNRTNAVSRPHIFAYCDVVRIGNNLCLPTYFYLSLSMIFWCYIFYCFPPRLFLHPVKFVGLQSNSCLWTTSFFSTFFPLILQTMHRCRRRHDIQDNSISSRAYPICVQQHRLSCVLAFIVFRFEITF